MSAQREAAASAVRLHEDLLIPVGSETVAATRYEPGDDGPHPALLMYTPYHKDDIITFGGYDPLVRYLAAHGYEVVVADMVGTGASSGTIEEMFPRREAREAVAIVEWLADREWTTGRVGMFGKSYGGITALYAAAERPDALDAIVPIHTPYTGFRNGYFGDGLFEFFGIGGDWLPLMQVLDAKPPSRRDREGRWADVWRERLDAVREREPWLQQFRGHETKDEYWADKDIAIERIETPTFAVGGWRDGYTTETLEYFPAIDAPKRLLLGPWRHVMPHRGREATVDFRRQVVEWFDRFLKDEDNDALTWPTVTYWTEREGGGEPGRGVWRGRETWPTVEETDEAIELALSPEGLVPADEFEVGELDREYEFDQTVGIDSTDDMIGAGDGHPIDTHADDQRSLAFETEPLSAPVELTGTGRATVRLASAPADPLVVVRVVDVSPDGVGRLVTRGFVRPDVQEGVADEGADGERTVTVPLKAKSHVFEADHRIRVAISAAHFPLVMPASGQGSFTVASTPEGASTVSFPGVRHGAEDLSFEDTVELRPPDESIPADSTFLTEQDSSWEATRDRTDGTAVVRSHASYAFDLPAADSVQFAQDIEATVRPDDPGTAVLRSDTLVEIERETERCVVDAETRLARDTAQQTTRVTIDGTLVFEETWAR